MEMYICYDTENGQPETRTEEGWRQWWNEYGDKKDYPEFSDWFLDCVRLGLLIPETDSGRQELEQAVFDILSLSMEHNGEEAEIWESINAATDEELRNFIAESEE